MSKDRIRNRLARRHNNPLMRCDGCRYVHLDFCQPCPECYAWGRPSPQNRNVFCQACQEKHVREAHQKERHCENCGALLNCDWPAVYCSTWCAMEDA